MDSLLGGRIERSRFSGSLDEAFSAVKIFDQTIIENVSLRRTVSNLEAENHDLRNRLQEGRQALSLLATHVFGEQHRFYEGENRIGSEHRIESNSYSRDFDETRALGGKLPIAGISEPIPSQKVTHGDGWTTIDSGSIQLPSVSSAGTVRQLPRSPSAVTVSRPTPRTQTNVERTTSTQELPALPQIASKNLTKRPERLQSPDHKNKGTGNTYFPSSKPLPKPTKKNGLSTSRSSRVLLERRLYEEQVAWQTAEDSLWRDMINEEPEVTTSDVVHQAAQAPLPRGSSASQYLELNYRNKPPGDPASCTTLTVSPSPPHKGLSEDLGFHGIYLKNLPKKTDLESLCKSIRGGRIHRIFLYGSGKLGSEALIAFVEPAGARRLYQIIQTEGLHITGHKTSLKASKILSNRRSDYNVNSQTQKEIMECGWTRCLVFTNVPKALTVGVIRYHVEEKVLWVPGKKKIPLIESIVSNEKERSIHLNMAGIYLAQTVRAGLRNRKEYHRVKISYARDPCEIDDKPVDHSSLQKIDHLKEIPLSNPSVGTAPPPSAAIISPLKIYHSALLSAVNPNPQCRKLVFARLPHRTTLSSLTQNIRGGVVESIYLYKDDTEVGPDAIVIFREPKAAWYCYLYFKTRDPIISGGKVILIPFDNTRPDPRPESKHYSESIPAIARRSVRLSGLPKFTTLEILETEVKSTLDLVLKYNYVGRPSELLESVAIDQCKRGAEIVFSQIRVANNVIRRLKSKGRYTRCTFSYSRDPCEGRIEELFPDDGSSEGLGHHLRTLKPVTPFQNRPTLSIRPAFAGYTPRIGTNQDIGKVFNAGVDANLGREVVGPRPVETVAGNPRGDLQLPPQRVKPEKMVRFALDFE